MAETDYRIEISLTNETDGVRFAEFDEPLEDWLTDDEGRPDFGAIYRQARQEYGRCTGSVYVDNLDNPARPIRVGWHFVKRDEYDGPPTRTCQAPHCDNPKHFTSSYLRGAWVTVTRVVAPAQPEQRAYVAVT